MQLNFDILNKNENTSIDFTNKGTFNMDKQTIDFNDKIYNYDNELIITDKKSINDQIKWMENEGKQFKYPQGFEYCRDIIQRRRENGGRIHGLECQSTKTALFFKA